MLQGSMQVRLWVLCALQILWLALAVCRFRCDYSLWDVRLRRGAV
jgi:hypothetical protein